MKRLHIHISVDDLAASMAFYSAMFATQPSVIESDYAKWLLDDPKVNFAISQRGRAVGLDHLGIQVESAEELAMLEQRLQQAQLPHLAQPNSTCCYARSDKHWSIDPNGVHWELFQTLESLPTYGDNTRESAPMLAPETGCGCKKSELPLLTSPVVTKLTGSSCC